MIKLDEFRLNLNQKNDKAASKLLKPILESRTLKDESLLKLAQEIVMRRQPMTSALVFEEIKKREIEHNLSSTLGFSFDKTVIMEFKRSGLEINDIDEGGSNITHYLAKFGSKEEMEYAVKMGADLNVKDSYGNTPSIIANRYKNEDVNEFIKNYKKDTQFSLDLD